MKAIRNSKGFTLIELLVVVAIIGILAAIAIPQFALYRQKGFDARSESDLRNAATGEEANYASNQVYISCTDDACNAATAGGLPGFTHSSGVSIKMVSAAASFTGTSKHASGVTTWNYDSTAGGITN
jgi:type IV pilus assembly protein PilA